MALMKTSNPALNRMTANLGGQVRDAADAMTLQGTVNKTGFLLILLAIPATVTWNMFRADPTGSALPIALGALIGGFIVALVTIFKMSWAPVTAPLYAILEGLCMGAISAVFELKYHGIAIEAVGLTFATLLAMLIAYSSGLIRPSENFKLGIVAATGGIALLYLATIGLSFFGVQIPYIYGNGPIGIAFSLFVAGLAALNLVLDFDLIETAVTSGAPKYMEWYGAFGILVTLIWLYLELLRLLAKLSSRR
jgi:uncharacterized YccA/Bax inhibitor family protein